MHFITPCGSSLDAVGSLLIISNACNLCEKESRCTSEEERKELDFSRERDITAKTQC